MSTQLETKPQTMPQSAIKDMGFHSGPAFGLLRAAAEFLAKADIIPKQFQGNLPNCAVALNMAQRMGADPLMVMQNLYVVYGRPSWSAQFLIATMNTKGDFSKLRYQWSDETDKKKDAFGCRACATELATGEQLYGPWVTVGLAKSEGWYSRESKTGGVASKWPTLTELMCMYRAAAFFVRTYCPEIAMGLRTSDEEEEIHASGAVNVTRDGSVMERTSNMPPPYSAANAEGNGGNGSNDAPADAEKVQKETPIAPAAAPVSAPKQTSKPKPSNPTPPASPAENPNYGSGSDPDPFAGGSPLNFD
jgi:hypothetical protein